MISTQMPPADRITTMVHAGIITQELANAKLAKPMLESDTLRDFLQAFPAYRIRDGQIPPLYPSEDGRPGIPDTNCLIACVVTQWARHFLISNRSSTNKIGSIGEPMDKLMRQQVPKALSLLFRDNPKAFLNADVLMQQTLVLSTQDTLERLCPRYADDFDGLVEELEDDSPDRLRYLATSVCYVAQAKLERLALLANQSK